MTDYDFSAFEGFSSNEDEATLANLMTHAETMRELKAQIDDVQATLDSLNKHYNYIAQEIIPNMLDELGLKKFELKDGSQITVKDFMSGSLPKEENQFNTAIQWLKDNDLENILKTDVTIKFGKGEENRSQNAIGMLEENGYEPDVKYGVHPQTLYASIRELTKEGVVIPYEMLGLYAGKKADIKLSK